MNIQNMKCVSILIQIHLINTYSLFTRNLLIRINIYYNNKYAVIDIIEQINKMGLSQENLPLEFATR